MNEHGTYGIWPQRDPELRASDADRESFGERLRHSHADGRLSTEEFQERIDRCYSATTVGELEQLATDLPAERPRRARLNARRLWVVPLVPIVIAIFAISAVTGGHHWHSGIWVIFPLLFLLRFMFVGRYHRWGGWQGPRHEV